MLLSEARPRPYRTTRSERDDKFADVYGGLDVAYRRYHLSDKRALQSRNWKEFSSWKRGREYILMRELVNTYQQSNTDMIQLYDTSTNNGLTASVAFYYIIEANIPSKIWKKFNKYFRAASNAGVPLHDLFPELKDIFDRDSKLFVQGRDFQGCTTFRIILGFINYDKLDFNMQMSARLRQLDAIIEKIKSRVSEKELEARAYKVLTNMLKASTSAPDTSDDDDEE